MENLNKEIGERIRFIRSIFNEGGKLSASQFAHLLGESVHKILNYESGRVQVPPSFLLSLYKRGVNPIFILSGEGEMFAPNAAGRELKRKLEAKLSPKQSESPSKREDTQTEHKPSALPTNVPIPEARIDELIELARSYTVAAGDIMRLLSLRKKNE